MTGRGIVLAATVLVLMLSCDGAFAQGTVWAWGSNGNGQLGNGTTNNSSVPVQMTGLAGVVAIAAGQVHSMALKNDGTVWTWGDNVYAQLGNGNFYVSGPPLSVASLTPVQVLTGIVTPIGPVLGSPLGGVVAIGAGGYHSLAVTGDGTIWSWGYNGLGQLGDGFFEVVPPYNHAVATPSSFPGSVAIKGATYDSVALRSDGSVWISGT